MPRLKPLVAGSLVVLLMIQTTGCSSWKPVAQPWPEAIAAHPKRQMEFLLADGRTIKADSARARADTLYVYFRERADTIPVSQVGSMKSRQHSGAKTLGLVIGIVGGVALVYYVSLALCFDSGNCG